jgi:hypothetical protein
VPLFYYTCDEGIADLISIMNYCGIRTVNSCQDNRGNRGDFPCVWVEILGQDLMRFLAMLDRAGEADETESISRRMMPEPRPDPDYQENRAWHHKPLIQRVDGMLAPLTMSIRFPDTDLSEVLARLRTAAMELDGRVITKAEDGSPSPESGSPGDDDEP